jgi:hypothetical protein
MPTLTVGAPARTCLPRWFSVPLALGLMVALALALVGLPLAMAGWFHAPIVIPAWLLASVLLSVLVWRHLPSDDRAPSRAEHVVTALVVVGAGVYALWTGLNHAQHLIVDRDPGVYLTTGAWVGKEGNLRVGGLEGPFAEDPGLRPSGSGFSPNDDGSLSPQFPHLTAVVLGTASWLDERAMFVTNALVGGAVLLCVYAVASTLMRPFWAASAAGLLALTLPFSYFTRDTYSEPLAALFLFGGLWLLASSWDRPSVSLGCIVGALLGATCMVRIDGLVSLVPLAAVLVIELRAETSPRRSWAIAALVAMLATAAVGVLETRVFSTSYYDAALRERLPPVVGGVLVAGIAAVVLTRRLWHRSGGPDETPTGLLKWATGALVVGVAGVVIWTATVRPDTSGLPETSADIVVGMALDLLDQAETLSYRWLEWYTGRFSLAVAFVALLALTAYALLDARLRHARAFAGMVLATTILYLISPHITPEQVWATRRFIVVTVPGLLIALAWAADRLWSIRPREPLRWVGATAAVALIAVTAATTAWATRPLRAVRDGVPMHLVVEHICDVVDDEPSALLVSRDNLMSVTMPESLRVWCEVPVAGAGNDTNSDDVEALARAWEAEGRQLFVLSIQPAPFDGGLTGRDIELPVVALRTAEPTITRRPEALVPDQRAVKGEGSVLTPHLLEVDPNDR